MQNAGLAIFYDPEHGRPFTVARVSDRDLLIAVAEAAIEEAEARAQAMGEMDEFIGAVQREEAARIRRVLGILVPEVHEPVPACATDAEAGRDSDADAVP